jgi:hypothetical protein
MQKRISFFDTPADLEESASSEIFKTKVVLDIGCGIRPMGWFTPKVYLCVEPFSQYVEALQARFKSEPNFVILQMQAKEALLSLPKKSVDSVFLLDVIEHIEKEEGLLLLRECERVARRQIVVCTPLGYMEQKYEGGEKDAWGLEGAEFQTHRSGWTPEDFDDSWHFLVCKKYHEYDSKHTLLDEPFGVFYALKEMDRSQYIPLERKLLLVGSHLPPSDPGGCARDSLLTAFKDFDPKDYGVLSTRNQQPYNVHFTMSLLDYANSRFPCKYHFFDIPDSWNFLHNLSSRDIIEAVGNKNSNFYPLFQKCIKLVKDNEYRAIAVFDNRPNEFLLAYCLSTFLGFPLLLITAENYQPLSRYTKEFLTKDSLILKLPNVDQESDISSFKKSLTHFLNVSSVNYNRKFSTIPLYKRIFHRRHHDVETS